MELCWKKQFFVDNKVRDIYSTEKFQYLLTETYLTFLFIFITIFQIYQHTMKIYSYFNS